VLSTRRLLKAPRGCSPTRSASPLNITNLRERFWKPALRRAGLRQRTLYQTEHTFVTLMLAAGEPPGWIARQLGHTTVEMIFRRYYRFIPNLRGRDGAAAAAWLKKHGL
jgi:integrase